MTQALQLKAVKFAEVPAGKSFYGSFCDVYIRSTEGDNRAYNFTLGCWATFKPETLVTI